MWSLYSNHHKKYTDKRHQKDSGWIRPPKQSYSNMTQQDILNRQANALNLQGFPLTIYPSYKSASESHPRTNERKVIKEESQSSIDTGISGDGSQVFTAVKDLSSELKQLALSNAIEKERKSFYNSTLPGQEMNRLELDTTDVWFRKNLLDHAEPYKGIKDKIEFRRLHSPFGKMKSQSADVDIPELIETMETDGLIPALPIHLQIKLLKMKERLLLIDRWEALWEQVRTPLRNWHSISKKGFSQEMKRHNLLLNNPELQALEMEFRTSLMDFERTLFMNQVSPY